MFPVPLAWTLETGLPLKAWILDLWDTTVPVISGACTEVVCSSLLPIGQGRQYQSQGAEQAPTIWQMGHVGRGQGQDSHAGTSRTQGRVDAITSQTELADQSVIQDTFLLFRL